jgi:CheY-like chemotaxis protein
LNPRSSKNQRRKSILVVDDEPGIVAVLITVLEDAGHRAAGAADGHEALSRLKVSKPDLMLLDVEMPALDGGETLRALKADPRLSTLPVLMMSGIPESMVKRRCRGYDAFLRKPFSLDELLETVAALLDRAASRRRASRPLAQRAPAKKKNRPGNPGS